MVQNQGPPGIKEAAFALTLKVIYEHMGNRRDLNTDALRVWQVVTVSVPRV